MMSEGQVLVATRCSCQCGKWTGRDMRSSEARHRDELRKRRHRAMAPMPTGTVLRGARRLMQCRGAQARSPDLRSLFGGTGGDRRGGGLCRRCRQRGNERAGGRHARRHETALGYLVSGPVAARHTADARARTSISPPTSHVGPVGPGLGEPGQSCVP